MIDKVVIVTGGAGLIGRQICSDLCKKGSKVVVLDVTGEEFVAQLRNEGNDVIFFKCDITKKEDIQKMVIDVVEMHGKIDVLVNNAYPRNSHYGRRFEDVEFEDFCENVNMHLGGYFLVSKIIAEQMKKQGAGVIINMASIYGFAAPRFEIYEGTEMTMPVEYSAIKGAIVNLTKYLASYFGKNGIRVNAVSPGGVFDNQNPKFVSKYLEKAVSKRMTKVEDISNAVMFLASEESKYITGQNLVVDGGWSL